MSPGSEPSGRGDAAQGFVVRDVGIKEIAKRLKLSVSTVSRALNGVYGVNPATRKIVEETARELGYVPHLGAKQLVGKRSNLIGVFLPQFEFEASFGYIGMFSPLQQALQSHGKDALFFSVPYTNYPAGRLSECVGSRSLEGCVVFNPFGEEHPLIREALKLGVPFVNFEDFAGERFSSIISDDREGGRMAGKLLLERGHRAIGYVNGPSHVRVCRERYAGLREALEEYGIAHDSRLYAEGDFSGASGAACAAELRERNPDMTAMFCANDLMAMGAIMALTERQVKLPSQMSIIGYDDDQFTAYTTPQLTTVRHSVEEISRAAVRLLVELMDGKTGSREAVSPRLVERKSVTGVRT